jgi:hypothetical protein
MYTDFDVEWLIATSSWFVSLNGTDIIMVNSLKIMEMRVQM